MGLKKNAKITTAEDKAAEVSKDAEVIDAVVEEKVVEKTTEVSKDAEVIDAVVEEKVVEKTTGVSKDAEVIDAVVEEKVVEKAATKSTIQIATKVAGPSEMVKASAGFSQQAADQGFEGLEVGGYGTFPSVVIGTGGCFELDGEEEEFKTVEARLETTKALYLCKQKGVQEGPTAFTYDQVNLNSEVDKCLTVAELRAAWEEEGEEMEIKKYLEVLVEIVDEEDDKVGQFVIMKIAPSSINKFNGIPFLASRRNVPLNTVVVEFGIGKRRESKGGNKYTPWTFKDITSKYE